MTKAQQENAEFSRVVDKIAKNTPKKPITASIGHNSEVSGQRLKSFVERVERLEEEKKAIAEDIRDVYSEAKGQGFDVPTIRKLVSERKKNIEKRREQLELFDLYSSAIGMAE